MDKPSEAIYTRVFLLYRTKKIDFLCSKAKQIKIFTLFNYSIMVRSKGALFNHF